MREQLEKRLDELKAEYEQGEKMLSDLDARREQVRQTLLRISGAVQILEEMLKVEGAVAEKPPEKSQ
ncbi:MAG: hypothetical protein NTU95_03470 [Methanothrix sp.]|nr:hypothetical protein [Methanothrix sp.]